MADSTQLVVAPATATEKTKSLAAQVGAHGVTALTVLAALGWISPEDANGIIAAVHQLNDGIVQTVGALGKLWIIIGPIAAVLLTRLGVKNETVQNVLANLTKLATSGSVEQQKAVQATIATTTAKLPLVNGIVAPELAADPSTPGNVVATPAALPK